jgi:hypothetical protein
MGFVLIPHAALVFAGGEGFMGFVLIPHAALVFAEGEGSWGLF